MEKIKGLSVHKGEIIYENYLIFAEIQICFAKNKQKSQLSVKDMTTFTEESKREFV